MQKLLSEIKGSRIILFQEQALVGEVNDYLIDHEKGMLLGVFLQSPLDKKLKVIPTSEFKGIGDNHILVSDLNSLTDLDDFIRGAEVIKTDAKIILENAVTEMGSKLGKVSDATFDLIGYKLARIYVRPRLGMRFAKELIIPAEKIIEIKKNTIVIADEAVTVKAKKVSVPVPTVCE